MSLVANPAERLLDPEAVRPVLRPRFAGLLVLSLVINALFLYALVREAFPDDVDGAMAVETPVEVVPEIPSPDAPEPPAPEEQPKKEDAPKPPPPEPQNTLDEKPAIDAPRAANEEKIEREAPDDTTKAPRQAPPSAQAGGQPDAETRPQATPEVAATAPAQERPDEKADAEVLRHAEQTPSEPAKPDPRPQAKGPAKKGTLSNEELLAAFAPMPEFEIGSRAEQTPVAGGKAKSTYLTILFGMIMPRMQTPLVARGAQRRYGGVVTFFVNGWGGITHIGLSRPSGSAELDAAAVSAVRNAAPFPPPPGHRPLSLNFTYGSK